MALVIVKAGTWLYEGRVEAPVDIIALDYDWWYSLAEADGQLKPGEQPMALGSDGFFYYVRFQKTQQREEPTWPDSPGYVTVAEAMKYAESKVVGDIKWHKAT